MHQLNNYLLAPFNTVKKFELIEEDLINIFKTSINHNTSLITFDHYKQSIKTLTPTLYTTWLKHYLMQKSAHGLLYANTKTSLQALQKPFAVLKGPLLKDLYDDPCHRTMCDMDVLIDNHQRLSYQQAFSEVGYMYKSDFKHDAHDIYEKEGHYHIEAHWRLLDPVRFKNPDWFNDQAWSNKVPYPDFGHNAYRLSHHDHFVFLLCHAVKHISGTGLGLRQLYDIKLYYKANSNEIDLGRVYADLGKLGVLKPSVYLLAVLNTYLETSFNLPYACDQTRVEDLFNDIMRAGIHGSAPDYKLEAVHFRKARANALEASDDSKWRIFLPPLSKMKRTYDYLEDKPYLLPYAWAKRLKYQLKVHKKESLALFTQNINHANVNKRLDLMTFLEQD